MTTLPSKDALRLRLKRFTTKYPYVLDEAEFNHDLKHGVTTYRLTGVGVSKRVELATLFKKQGFVPAFQVAEPATGGAGPVVEAFVERQEQAAEEAVIVGPVTAAVEKALAEPARAKKAPQAREVAPKPVSAPSEQDAQAQPAKNGAHYSPRPGTKLFGLYQRLVSPEGVSLAEGMVLMSYSDPHYVRSSSHLLSRRAGMEVECTRSKEENGTRYRLLPRA